MSEPTRDIRRADDRRIFRQPRAEVAEDINYGA
jgi:hypothetical protein